MGVFDVKRIQVPGLLSDDALAEQLKLITGEAKSRSQSAPPPTAAFDFADKIVSDFLQPSAQIAGGKTDRLPSVLQQPIPERFGRASPQTQAIDQRSDALVEGVGAIESLPGIARVVPGVGLIQDLGDIGAAGTLNEEERQIEAEARAKELTDREAAFKSKAQLREQLRGLSDEDAQRMGLPIAPGLEAERQRQGELDERTVQSATERAEEAKASITDKTKQPTQTWWLNAAQTAAKSAAQTGTSALKYPTEWWELTAGRIMNGGDIERSEARAWIQTADAAITKLLPGDKARAKDFVTELSQGAGSFAGYMTAGYVGTTLGAPAWLFSGVLGAMSTGSQMYEEAEQFGAVGLQKYMALIAGTGLGMTEAIPVDRIFMATDLATGGFVRRMLQVTAAGSATEFMQELSQSLGYDIAAKYAFDPEREIDLQKAVKEGMIGGILGGVGGVAATALNDSGVITTAVQQEGVEAPAKPSDADQEKAVVGEIDALQQVFDATPDLSEADVELTADELLEPITAQDGEMLAKVEGEQVFAGGTIPVGPDGKFEITHFARSARDVLDPAMRGTGPIRGQERARLFGEDAVDRVYYGVNARRSLTPQEVKAGDFAANKRAGYVDEGLGDIRHTVKVDPDRIYNWFEDPLGLKAQLDRSTPASEQVTRYERLIKDAGFDGVYISEGTLGQTAMMFTKETPERVINDRFGVDERLRAKPQDFKKPTKETFQKPGWAIITATQEAAGGVDTPANVAANEKLRKELKRLGIEFQEVKGSYQGIDQGPNFLIFAPTANALKLAQKYKQESILTSLGLEYSDGRLTPAVHEETVVGDEARQRDFFSTLPSGESFSVGLDFDATQPVDDLLAARAPTTPERVKKLTGEVAGLRGVLKHLQPDEQTKLRADTARKIVDLFTKLPDPKEMAAVAISGRAKRGWYRRSAQALVDIFGLEDAPRFAGLLAALSPQTSVESNAANALTMWVNWTADGRPQDEVSIRRLLGKSVQGAGTESSVLPAWVPNSITALTTPNSLEIRLSGPKVNSFMLNLQGVVNEVTNDAWMANFANVDQTLFKKTGQSPGKGPGYIAMNAAVRSAAETATRLTGEQWTPAEIQETVWSWAKTLYEKASNLSSSAEEILAAGGLTAEEISATPDFASLFVSGVYRNILEKGGYDLEAIGRGEPADGQPAVGGDPLSAEGSGFAQQDFERNLRRAARRLDALRQRRREEALPENFEEQVTNDNEPVDLGFAGEDEGLEFFAAQDRGTAMGRGPYSAEQTRPQQGIEDTGQQQAADAAELSLNKISRNVIRLMNLTARQGRLTLKGSNVMGQYSKRSGAIRIKTWGDLSTIVHEAGHALHNSMGAPMQAFVSANEQRLMDVATALYGGDTNVMPRATHIAEGVAEFFRVYTLNKAFAERQYPQLTTDFDALLEANAPQLKQGLEVVGQQFAAWLQLPSAQLIKNMVVPGRQDQGFNAALKELREVGVRTWMSEYARKSVAESVNRYASLNAIVSQMLNVGQTNQKVAIDLKRAEDPRTLIRLARNSGARAMVQLTDGVMGYKSTQSSTRGLRDALLISQGLRPDQSPRAINEARAQDFDAYLVSLRALDEYRRMAEGKIERPPLAASLGDVQKTVKELGTKYPAFVEAAQIVNEFGMALWKKQYDAGLMDKSTYTEGLDRRFYVPLQRDMSDKKSSLGPSALTARGGGKIVKRFKGSDRDIVSPFTVLMHKTFALEQIIAENDVKKALAVLSDRAGKTGALVERIPASQMIGKSFTVSEVARQITKDENISEMDAQDLMTILAATIEEGNSISLFRSEQAGTKGENIVFFWENGKLAALQLADGAVGADVVNMMNGVGRENMQLGVELIAATSTVFRTAITSWPDFLIVNFIRDQMSAWILSDVGFKPFATGIRGMGDELRQRSWAKQYNASMGIMGGMNVAALHEARVSRDINALRGKGYIAKAFNEPGILGSIKGFAHVVELSETGTRLGLFRKAFERAKKDGLNDWDASIEASYLATDYIDFGLNGTRMTAARRLIPFLNAQLQGLYKMMRVLGADEVRQRKGLKFALKAFFKNSHGQQLSRVEQQALMTGKKAWLKMASLGLISAALHFLFEDDPDYQEAGEYLRTTGWVIPMGDGRLFYIPKPFELALMANAVERGLESASGDPQAKGRFMRGVALSMTPPTAPPAIQTLVELAANKDFFTGQEIVPSYMQALAPELQYNNYTSELSKKLGEATGLSPMVIEHIVSSLGASAYKDIAAITNAFDPDRPDMDETDAPILRRFVRDARRGSASSQDFWSYASKMTGKLQTAATTYKEYIERGNEAGANRFLASLDEDDKAFALLNAHFKTDAKRLNPFYRARQVTTIVSGMRRELVSDLGLEDTTTKVGEPIKIGSAEKQQLDEILSEIARREMRNTLVATRSPGWADKKQIDVGTSIEMLGSVDPRIQEEFNRRVNKAKVYDAQTVFEYWPEVKDRLLMDRELAVLTDIVTIAKVMK